MCFGLHCFLSLLICFHHSVIFGCLWSERCQTWPRIWTISLSILQCFGFSLFATRSWVVIPSILLKHHWWNIFNYWCCCKEVLSLLWSSMFCWQTVLLTMLLHNSTFIWLWCFVVPTTHYMNLYKDSKCCVRTESGATDFSVWPQDCSRDALYPHFYSY